MKDRVPLYPGRVKLEPVAGQANTYDMTRADQPQQIGTKLNKANLLTDETVQAIFGTVSDKTPNEAFAALASAIAAGAKIQTGSYVGTGTYGQANPCSLTFDFVPEYWSIYALGIGEAFSDSLQNFFPFGATRNIRLQSTQGGSTISNSVTYNEKTVTWYDATSGQTSPSGQLNNEGWTYYYMAIG